MTYSEGPMNSGDKFLIIANCCKGCVWVFGLTLMQLPSTSPMRIYLVGGMFLSIGIVLILPLIARRQQNQKKAL